MVRRTLSWNIHTYTHSHLDVHPPIRVPMPFRFEWHQDGGRQNREIETTPRPRLSVKLAYWLSDVSEPGRGNLKVVPGSHLANWIDGPPRRDIEWPDPDGAIEVTAEPGDAVFFDRRIWHARSRNYSEHTRKAVFFGYTYRWTAIRDDIAPIRASDWFAPADPRPAAAARRRRRPRRGPRMGPRPGGHPAVRLAEGAGLPRPGQSAAEALRLTSPGLRAMRLSRPATHPAWPHPAGCVIAGGRFAHDGRRAPG